MAIFPGAIFGAGKLGIMPHGVKVGNTKNFLGRLKKCSSCFLLTACLGIGRVTRSRLIIWLFALAVLSWKVEHTKKFLGSLTFC